MAYIWYEQNKWYGVIKSEKVGMENTFLSLDVFVQDLKGTLFAVFV